MNLARRAAKQLGLKTNSPAGMSLQERMLWSVGLLKVGPPAPITELPTTQKRGEKMDEEAIVAPKAKKKLGRPPTALRVDGDKVKKLRGDYSQADFADKCAIDVRCLQRAENSEKVGPEHLEKIAAFATDVLNQPTKVSDLVSFE